MISGKVDFNILSVYSQVKLLPMGSRSQGKISSGKWQVLSEIILRAEAQTNLYEKKESRYITWNLGKNTKGEN